MKFSPRMRIQFWNKCILVGYSWFLSIRYTYMMTSSNGNIFRVTGLLCGEFHAQRPVTRSFDVFFDLRLNKRLSEQSRRWWFETPWRSLWRHSLKTTDRQFDNFVVTDGTVSCHFFLQLTVPLVTTKLSNLWSFVFSVVTDGGFTILYFQ